MWQQLIHFLQPPTFDDLEKSRVAHQLNLYLLIAIAIIVLAALIQPLITGSNENLSVRLFFLITVPMMWFVMHRGYVYQIASIFILFVWFSFTILGLAISDAHMSALFTSGYIVPVLMAGTFFGNKQVFVLVIVSLLMQIGITMAKSYQLIPEFLDLPASPTLSIPLQTSILLFGTATLSVSITTLRNTLDKAHLKEQQLQASIRERDHEIAHRQKIEQALQEAKAEAEAANQAKTIFLAAMNHEIRTPLGSIMGYGSMLEGIAKEREDEWLATRLTQIVQSAELLNDLITDVFDLSKLELNQMATRKKTIDLNQWTNRLLNTITPYVTRNGNKFIAEIHPELGTLQTDPTRLSQILLNLLKNAGRFTHKGTITLKISRLEQNVCFVVEDTGIGMSPDELEKIFQPFVQANEMINRQYGGTGLGLAITKQLCRLLGGDIQVQSEPLVGSTFIVTIPTTHTIIEPAKSTL